MEKALLSGPAAFIANHALGPKEGSRLPPRLWLAVRALALIGIIAVAYQYSLMTLLRGMGTEAPLAYLGLVPFISLLLAGALIYMPDRQRDIHDRFLDYYVGLPLIAIALVTVTLAPPHLSIFFWYWRLDLVSLPLFAAGAIALTFGVRTLWRLRLPVAFLFLAWPPPYTLVLSRWLDTVSNTTLYALHGLLRAVPVAVPLSDGSLFQITHGGQPFVLSVASACSGVNSIPGFMLVGGAAAALARGPRLNKLAWLVAGMALIWCLGVLRILLAFWVAKNWGETPALNVLHPFVGLLLFTLGTLGSIAVMPRFHLHLLDPSTGARSRSAGTGPPTMTTSRRAVPRAHVPMALILGIGAVLAVADAGMNRFELLSQDLGQPRIQSFTITDAVVPGWSLSRVASYPWVHLYFGTNSEWDRYAYAADDSARRTSTASLSPLLSPVTLDVISSSGLTGFNTYGVEACYHLHHDSLRDASSVDLGGGLVGHVVSYDMHGAGEWTAVYWVWPVGGGAGAQYQRVVLNETTGKSHAATEVALVGFARQIVTAAAAWQTSGRPA